MGAIAHVLLTSWSMLALTVGPAPLGGLHYELDGRLIHVPVRVNGVALWFDVDTGARHTVVDTAAAKSLHLVVVSTDLTSGAGSGTVTREHARPVDLAVGGVNMRVKDPWIIDLSHVGTNRHIDGLVGMDFLKAFVMRIDPGAQTISLFDPRRFQYDGRGAQVPLRIEDNRLFIPIGLNLGNGISAVHSVRVDTGSGDAVSDDLVRQSPERKQSVQGVGIGKSYVDFSGVFSQVQIGPYVIHDVWGPSGSVPAVGMEILQRFTMTFDTARGRLYLEPNGHLHDPVPAPE